MGTWKDPWALDPDIWRKSKLRLLIVCPEPNEQNMIRQGETARDMRELLLHDKRPRTQFPKFLRQVVRAVHNLPFEPNKERDAGAHESLMRRIAFIDLKETGGGRTSDPEKILQATKRRRSQILRQLRKWRPTHVAVAGWKAQYAFKACFPELLGEPRQGSPVVFDIYHPSSREFGSKSRPYYDHVRKRLREVGS